LASISEQPDGRRTIQFVGADGKRRSLRLGKVPRRSAEGIKRYVEMLNAAKISKQPIDGETAAWVAGISDWLANKLARVGLIAPRARRLLGDFVDDYIASRLDLKERTRTSLRVCSNRLVAYLKRDRPIESITPADIDKFLIHLKVIGRSPLTVGKTINVARQLFRAAIRARLIADNPCDGVKAPSQANPKRMYFVEREDIARVMDVADREWRLIIALARYGGLRTPSELAPLQLTDIDFERGRLRVTSPKTERHDKGERWIPLFPELLPHVEAAYETAAEGETYLVRHPSIRHPRADATLRGPMLTLLRRAGVKPWPRLFQNLRARRETELAREFPIHVAVAWIGNSTRVAQKHYLTVTDADFDRARGAQSGAKSGAVSGGRQKTADDETRENTGEFH
jgi:integrase